VRGSGERCADQGQPAEPAPLHREVAESTTSDCGGDRGDSPIRCRAHRARCAACILQDAPAPLQKRFWSSDDENAGHAAPPMESPWRPPCFAPGSRCARRCREPLRLDGIVAPSARTRSCHARNAEGRSGAGSMPRPSVAHRELDCVAAPGPPSRRHNGLAEIDANAAWPARAGSRWSAFLEQR